MQRVSRQFTSASLRSLSAAARPQAFAWAKPATLSRSYAAASGLSRSQIQDRVLEVLKTFEKVSPEKVTPESSFTKDLGLDSLDAVEVVMAIEEEFAVEMSDEDADKITTVGEAIAYIEKTPEAH